MLPTSHSQKRRKYYPTMSKKHAILEALRQAGLRLTDLGAIAENDELNMEQYSASEPFVYKLEGMTDVELHAHMTSNDVLWLNGVDTLH